MTLALSHYSGSGTDQLGQWLVSPPGFAIGTVLFGLLALNQLRRSLR